MYKLLEFIRSIYVVLLFVLFEALAVHYYAHSTVYTQARLLSRSNQVVGSVHGLFAGVRHYFSLGSENKMLLDRVTKLEGELAAYKASDNAVRLEDYMTGGVKSPYRLMTACVVSNTINRSQNLITLDKGTRHGVIPEMAVLTPDGAMVGYVVDCSERYSVVMSVLNTSFRASGKIVGEDYFGSIYWDGLSQYEVVMDELSKYAAPEAGKEIVSTGFSQYFPADILIGWVDRAELNETKTAYKVTVRLAAEVSRLTDVILVENKDLAEMRALERSDKVKQHTQRN